MWTAGQSRGKRRPATAPRPGCRHFNTTLTLDTERAHLVKVRVVNVRVDAEQTAQDGLGRADKGRGELYANALREDLFVVDNALRPCHERLDVRRRRQVRGLLVRLAVLPVKLVFRARIHDRALARSAKLGNGAVDHVDVVEKVDDWGVSGGERAGG